MKKEDELKAMLADAAAQLRMDASIIGLASELLEKEHPQLVQVFETALEYIEYNVIKIQKTIKKPGKS